MRTFRKRKILLGSVAIILLISACSPTNPQKFKSVPLISPGEYEVSSAAIAVEADGDKHIVWSECPTTGPCRLVYQRTKMGNAQQQILISEVGFNYLQPDIAVTSDGRAFIVFLKASTTANSTYSPQYIIIPAVDP